MTMGARGPLILPEKLEVPRSTSSPGSGKAIGVLIPNSDVEIQPQCRFRQEFENIELLGAGGFGEVFRARSKTDGQVYAVKRQVFSFRPQTYFIANKIRRLLMKEAMTLARMDYEHVTRYYGAWLEQSLIAMNPGPNERKARAAPAPQPVQNIYSKDDLSCTYGESFGSLGFTMERCSERPEAEDALSWASGPYKDKNNVRTNLDLGSIDFNDDQISLVAQPLDIASPKEAKICLRVEVYIQMALYDGNTLTDWLQERRTMCHAESLRVFSQIVSGLAYIHSNGLTHRDMKPSNIFMTSDCTVKIGDFGLAKDDTDATIKAKPSFLPNNKILDEHGYPIGVGTPLYSSPEQLEGHSSGAPADVYSLGLIFCEMLCVFKTNMERIETLRALREQSILPPSLEKHFPEEARLIRLLTSKRPCDRPECAEILSRYLPPLTKAVHHKGSRANEVSIGYAEKHEVLRVQIAELRALSQSQHDQLQKLSMIRKQGYVGDKDEVELLKKERNALAELTSIQRDEIALMDGFGRH